MPPWIKRWYPSTDLFAKTARLGWFHASVPPPLRVLTSHRNDRIPCIQIAYSSEFTQSTKSSCRSIVIQDKCHLWCRFCDASPMNLFIYSQTSSDPFIAPQQNTHQRDASENVHLGQCPNISHSIAKAAECMASLTQLLLKESVRSENSKQYTSVGKVPPMLFRLVSAKSNFIIHTENIVSNMSAIYVGNSSTLPFTPFGWKHIST